MRKSAEGVTTPLLPVLRFLVFVFLATQAVSLASAQGYQITNNRNHPELDWRVAETEHFRIAYPAHLAGIEFEAAAVAEASYAVLSEQLDVTFTRPIRIYLSDEDEIANGFAVNIGPAGHTNIWVNVNETAEVWTGDVTWMRKVLAHELAHIFHYRAVRSKIGLAQEIFSNPMPRFWTEGLAQYLTEEWDAQRGDRWLRTAVFEDRLSYEDGSSPWNGRLLYSTGNSQVRYLAQTYGDSTITNLLQHRSGFLQTHNFYSAFREHVGKPYSEFNEEWRKHVNVYYNTLAGQMERTDSLGTPLAIPGHFLYDVQYSPDTSRVAALVLTSVERPVRRLAVIEGVTDTLQTRDVRVIAEGDLAGPFSWHPAGTAIAYTRRVRGRHGSILNDIFVYDLENQRRTRITRSRRASHPAFSPDGSSIAYVANEGGTSNVFVRVAADDSERQLSRFTGETLLTGLRWSPEGSYLVISRFSEDGERDIVRIDAQTGEAQSLRTPWQGIPTDDRGAVFSPDGSQITYTSLRDHVPNVFIYNLADSTEYRATHLFAGATVSDWLPPDEDHPEGRLLVTSSESKRRERAYLIDAQRRVASDTIPGAPAEYSAWTTHRPEHTIPNQVLPDSSLIQRRSRYNSWANITHAMTMPLPYVEFDGSDFGLTGATLWMEPLGKHQIMAFGSVSLRRPLEDTYAALIYVNNQLKPTLSLALYRYPDPARWYGSTILVEDLRGVDVSASLPLDIFSRPFVGSRVDARLRFAYAIPYEQSVFDDLETTSPLMYPEEGYRFEARFGFAVKHQRPYRYNTIYPMDGMGIRLRTTFGLPVLGAEHSYVRPDLQAFWVSPEFGIGNLYLYGRAQAQFGTGLSQDLIGLSRYDDIDLQLEMLDPITLSDTERVRGYRQYTVGNRMLFGTLEYRIAPVFDLNTRILGFVSIGRISPAFVLDAGMVWTENDYHNASYQVGVGFELKNHVSLAGFPLVHTIGIAQPAEYLGDRTDWNSFDLYYRVKAVIPF